MKKNIFENQTRVIFPNKTPRDFYSIWNNEWVSEYESPWSILTKFSYINKISSDEMLREYGITKLKNTKGKIGDKYKSLYNLRGFDQKSINKALGRLFIEENDGLLESLLRATTYNPYPKYNSLSFHFMRLKLTFCPICIKEPYHSTLHQFHFIQKCPFHLVPLMNYCPDCQGCIPYIFDDSSLSSPYVCTCGYKFAQLNRRMDLKTKKIVKEKYLTDWFYNSKNYRERFNKLIILEERQNLEENFKYSLSDLYSIFNNTTPTITSKQLMNIEGKKQIFKIKNTLRIEHWHLKGPPKVDIDYQCNQLFNSIARHLRNGILKKHIHCIKQYTRYKSEICDEEKCPFAVAYVNWRRRLQDFRSIGDVDNFGTTPSFRTHYSKYIFPIWNGRHVINNILDKIDQLEKHDPNRETLRWVLFRFVAELILADFKRNLSLAASESGFNYYDDFLETFKYVANVIVDPPTNFSNMYKIYINNEHSIDYLCNELNIPCPNNSVNKRRGPKTPYQKNSPIQEVLRKMDERWTLSKSDNQSS